MSEELFSREPLASASPTRSPDGSRLNGLVGASRQGLVPAPDGLRPNWSGISDGAESRVSGEGGSMFDCPNRSGRGCGADVSAFGGTGATWPAHSVRGAP